jgi:hypothetical protein
VLAQVVIRQKSPAPPRLCDFVLNPLDARGLAEIGLAGNYGSHLRAQSIISRLGFAYGCTGGQHLKPCDFPALRSNIR